MRIARGMLRTGAVVAVVLLGLGLRQGLARGFSLTADLDAGGTASVSIGGRNVWRPTSVAVVLEASGAHQVAVQRSTGAGFVYPVAKVDGSGSAFVFIPRAAFWFRESDSLRVVVDPPAVGKVEVICE